MRVLLPLALVRQLRLQQEFLAKSGATSGIPRGKTESVDSDGLPRSDVRIVECHVSRVALNMARCPAAIVNAPGCRSTAGTGCAGPGAGLGFDPAAIQSEGNVSVANNPAGSAAAQFAGSAPLKILSTAETPIVVS